SAHQDWTFIENFHGYLDLPSSGYGSDDDLSSMEETKFTDTISYEGPPTLCDDSSSHTESIGSTSNDEDYAPSYDVESTTEDSSSHYLTIIES
ncbi:hypothetical protein KI387_027063, partial [Taxus chinensis]